MKADVDPCGWVVEMQSRSPDSPVPIVTYIITDVPTNLSSNSYSYYGV